MTDKMERKARWIVTYNVWVWLAVLPFFIPYGSSKLDKRVAREITSDNNPGFISIDCGSNVDYLDKGVGIWFETDKDFVETGENHVVSPVGRLINYPYFGRRVNTLRSFPDGNRNCYTLKPKQGKNNTYLIRAFFAYGNYDFKNQTPSFDLYIGVNYWETLGFVTDYQLYEIIHIPSTDTINVCLVKTGPTIPYISSLELRLLNTSVYQIPNMSLQQPLLSLEARLDYGAPKFPTHTRFKDDPYDRVWKCKEADNISSTALLLDESIDMKPLTKSDAYKLPAKVWRSALQSTNISYPLEFDLASIDSYLDKSLEYALFFHFAEIERDKKRIINITLNSENILSEPLVLEYLKPVTIRPHKTSQSYVRFNISATSESDSPPILNVVEIYKLITDLDSPTDTRDVGAILDIKNAYQISKLSWQGDPCVPKQYAWEGLNCSFDINPRITSLNLSSSKLTGEINFSFSNLTELEILDLSDNDLDGPLPEFLAKLTKLKTLDLSNNYLTGFVPDSLSQLESLTFLYLGGNKLSGSIPAKLVERSRNGSLTLRVDGNPYLCTSSPCHKRNKVEILLIVTPIGALILSVVLFFFFRRRLQVLLSMNKSSCSNKSNCVDSNKKEFTYSEVLSISNNFERVLGKGGFGTVYHGCIGETQVAVKMLSHSSQGFRQFLTEAKILTIVHHRCLTPLIGYCNEGTTLIYKYMPNGNLAEHLSDKNKLLLGWKQRLQIALDSAIGLEYLHNGCNPQIVHRDVKPSNILLDKDFRGKISDFGLSRIFSDECDTHVSTIIAGTPGYLDPEYYKTNKLTEKSDVYSFGIVLLEILTGKPVILKTHEHIHIIQWVNSMLATENVIDSIMDSRLQGKYDIETARRVIDVAMACVAPSSIQRPTMNQVMIELNQCLSSMENLGCASNEISMELISGESSLMR